MITSSQFKALVQGKMTKEELWSHGRNVPNILIEYENDSIVVKGAFELKDDLIFESGEVFEKEVFFDGGTFKNIVFRGGEFNKLLFRRGEFNGFVSIRGGLIRNLILLGGNFNHWLGTLDGNINKDVDGSLLAEDDLIIERFEIEGGSYSNNMWISGGEIKSMEVKCVTGVAIHFMPNDDKTFDSNAGEYKKKFDSKPRIRNLLISRYSNKDSFYQFSDLALDKLMFENYTNLGSITISRATLINELQIENSDLGKTTFIDCDFSKNRMQFDSSKITDIGLAGALLPKPDNIRSKDESDVKQKRLALSQLKKVYEMMGDNLSAGEYRAVELDTYRSMPISAWEKFNLGLNKITNDHGLRWDYALGCITIVAAIFYTLYCSALGFSLEFSSNGWSLFWSNSSYILEFINPVRKSDFLPKALLGISDPKLIPKSAIIVDGISRILMTYLLYQFIAAFRRFGKKSA